MNSLAKCIGLTLALYFPFSWAADAPVHTPTTTPAQGAAPPRANNTEINTRDKSGTRPTPQDQTNNEADRKLLAAVRRAIVNDKTLSTSAHNVKILAQDGVITLRGPVRSADEKSKIGRLAQQTASVSSVRNELDISTK